MRNRNTDETTLFEVKRCPKCGQVKKLDAFNRRKKNKDGLRYWCRECDTENKANLRQRYAAENADRDPYDGTIKRCSGVCGRDLPRTKDNWGKAPSKRDGLSDSCRECTDKGQANLRQRYAAANSGRDPYDGTIKRCSGECGRDLPRTKDNWGKSLTKKDGLHPYCRKCTAGLSGDIVERIEYLWRQEKQNGRGEWVHHGKAEWLDLLIAQRGRCALSEVKLTPENVSVDHIVPCGKGGSHELSNLRLVTAQVNTALWDGSDEDFIEMCRATINAHMNLLCYGTKENPGG